MNTETVTHGPPMQQAHSLREAWLAARQLGLGSSDAPTIMGCNPYQSPYSLWAIKCGLITPDNLDDNEKVYFGNLLEPIICDEYGRRTGRTLVDHGRYTQQIHPDMEWMTATLDREIVAEPSQDRPTGALEVKSTSAYLSRQWDEEPPLMAQVQLQHALAVTGWRWGSVAGLIGGQRFLYQDIQRNSEFIQLLIDKEGEFMELVRRGVPPEVDASDSTAETLRDLYPKDVGKTINLPGIAVEWDEELTQVKANLKTFEAIKQGLENKIKAELQDATTGVLDNGISYHYKTQDRAAYAVEAKSFRVLRRSAKGAKL